MIFKKKKKKKTDNKVILRYPVLGLALRKKIEDLKYVQVAFRMLYKDSLQITWTQSQLLYSDKNHI